MKKTILFLVLSTIFFSCKKKNAAEPESKNTNTPTPTTNTLSYNGFFTAEYTTNWQMASPSTTRYFSQATLSQTAAVAAIANPSYNGTITVNNTMLSPESIGSYVFYLDTTFSLNLSTQRHFQFISSTLLPSFTFNNTDNFPIYPQANGYLINDTLFLAQSLTLSLANTSGFDEASCTIYDYNSPSVYSVKIVPSGSSQIIFTSGDLSVFSTNATILCSLALKKYNTQTFSGKNFRFETSTINEFMMICQ